MNNETNNAINNQSTQANSPIEFVARIGTDISRELSPNGHKIANFQIYVGEKVAQGDKVVTESNKYQATGWRGMAEGIANRLRKGDTVKFTAVEEEVSYTRKNGEVVNTKQYTIKRFFPLKQSKTQARKALAQDGTNALAVIH